MTELVDLVVRARRVVTPDGVRAARVVVRAGVIVAVEALDDAPVAARESVDVPDDCALLPGGVDSHVHLQEPGPVLLEGFANGTRAALAGGVTTVADMPLDSVPVTVDVAALAAKQAAAREAHPHVDVAFWGGVVPRVLGRLAPLAEAGVVGFKAYLTDSGHPDFPALDAAQLRLALAETAALALPLAVHAEHGPSLAGLPAATGPRYADFLHTRPHAVEVRAVAEVVEAVRRTGGAAHVVHVSSAEAADLVSAARAEGLPLTAETCPHYLALAAEDVPDAATRFACCPPIRERANAERLWEHLAAGTLGLVVSDHSPLLGGGAPEPADFGAAPGGVVGLQVARAVTWTAARERGFGLDALAAWTSSGPAALAGLGGKGAGKGAIEPGRDADLVVLAPDQEWTVVPATLHHARTVTPWAGRRLAGVVRRVWLRGVPVDALAPGTGRLLTRSPRDGSATR